MKPMENNKAISQIKFPVRYDEEAQWIVDGNDMVVANIGHTELYSLDGFSMDAFGQALAELINGLDGRGNLQEGELSIKDRLTEIEGYVTQLRLDLQKQGLEQLEKDAYVIDMSICKTIDLLDSKPDRQVKSAEDFFQSKNGGKDSNTSVEHGETFTAKFVIDMMEIYAQQYK